MTGHDKKPDAVVIGASIGGLAAAACLAKAGKRALILESRAAPSEPIGPVYALDPLLFSELGLAARGLQFVARDLPLALPGPFGGHLLLGRDRGRAVRDISMLSRADAAAWVPYLREVYALARQMRRWWWSGMEEDAADSVLGNASARAQFTHLCLTGADAYLSSHFHSDAVIAAMLFDASTGGFHVSEPGSALALVWRAAQEVAGLEGATAMPVPGTLVWSLIKAAGAADFRCCATVTGLVIRDGRVMGVRLADGEEIETGLVFSGLSASDTLAWTGAPASMPSLGELRMLFSLREKIAFPSTRLILAERSGIYADAHETARAGRIATELPMELAAANDSATGVDRIAVTLRPVPAFLSGEERIQLAARAVQALSRQVPGAARLLSDVRFASSHGRATLAQLLAPSLKRVKTNLAGLYLCGADAEPLASLSGRAARMAVRHALKSLPPD